LITPRPREVADGEGKNSSSGSGQEDMPEIHLETTRKISILEETPEIGLDPIIPPDFIHLDNTTVKVAMLFRIKTGAEKLNSTTEQQVCLKKLIQNFMLKELVQKRAPYLKLLNMY
jgi:hypothetical protein